MGLQDTFGVNCRGLVDRWMDGQTDACIRTDRPPSHRRNAVRFRVITQADWFIKLITHTAEGVCRASVSSFAPPRPAFTLFTLLFGTVDIASFRIIWLQRKKTKSNKVTILWGKRVPAASKAITKVAAVTM